jgi:hypothetical protein
MGFKGKVMEGIAPKYDTRALADAMRRRSSLEVPPVIALDTREVPVTQQTNALITVSSAGGSPVLE